MSEIGDFRELGPDDQEVDQAGIDIFFGTIIGKIQAEPTAMTSDHGGMCAWDLDQAEHDALHLEFRLPEVGSLELPILDWALMKEVPEAVALFMRFREKHRFTSDPLTTHAEIEEIWIKQGSDGLRLRRRVYDKEQPNFVELDKLLHAEGGNRLYQDQMARFEESRERRIRQQAEADAEEEILGLNRMTNAEIKERIDLLQRL